MYRAMVGVGMLCGLLIVRRLQVTRPIIERNKAEALQEAIFHVLPEARTRPRSAGRANGFELLGGRSSRRAAGLRRLRRREALVGLAIEAQGMGYQDVIA